MTIDTEVRHVTKPGATIETLVEMLSRIGKPVKLAVG